MSRGFSRRPAVEFAVTALLSLALVVLVTMVLARRDVRVDFTEGQRRTLSNTTQQILSLLESPVEIVAFYVDVPQDRQRLRDLVERCREFTPHLSVDFIDPERRPDLAEAYGVTANRSVVFVAGDLRVRSNDPSEVELASALLRLQRPEPPLVLFTTGHGESSLEDTGSAGWASAANLLVEQNFQVRLLSTAAIERVPRDADLLVVAGAQRRFDDRESTLVVDHVLRGGSLLLLLEPYGASSLDSLVQRFGVVAEPGFVVDQSPEQANLTRNGDPRIALALGGSRDHPITRGFTYNTLFPLARGLGSVQPPPPGASATRLLQTQAEAWIETDPAKVGRGDVRFDPATAIPGPVGLAYAVELDLRRYEIDPAQSVGLERNLLEMFENAIDLRDPARVDTLRVGDFEIPTSLSETARIAVIGDADFASNANLRVQGNGELLLSTILWLTAQEELIAAPDAPDLNDPVVLDSRQLAAARWLGAILAPLAFFAVGAWMLWRRSRWV